MHPLVSPEIPDLNLLRALNRGLVPSHYVATEYRRSLDAYVRDYLKEEVFDEGLTRNVPAFSRFFDAMAYSHGELTNFANIARDCGVDAKTVKEYYQILVDTLLGTFVEPYKARQERQVITKAARFYLFDVGVAGAVTKRHLAEERGEQFGRAFEHLVLMELLAHRSYRNLRYDVHFWRTKSGLEVDFILGQGEVAIEVKGTNRVDNVEFRALRAFADEHRPRRAIVVCNERSPRVHGGIEVLPWREFLTRLWGGDILAG
jgi:predicted AAA+ superfamily ATPase